MPIVKEHEASKAKLSREWNLEENNGEVQYTDIGLKTLTKIQVVSTATQNRNKISSANADRV